MKRAFLIEMTVLKSYVRQLVGLGFFVSIFVSIGMQRIVSVPGVLTMMMFMMGSMSAAAYDEQSGWGLFRLTMPVSRRDVVLARYGVILSLGVVGALVGLVAVAVLTVAATAVELPAGLSAALAFSPENMQATLFASMFCMAMGSTISSIVTPIYFRLGQTKATQYIPMIVLLIFIVPFLVLGGTGVLDAGSVHLEGIMRVLAEVLAFIETPAGVAAFSGAALVFVLAVLGISATVSLKLYESREL
ncbi:ABC-2 transporter permease [Enorma phocaeensis]|uniref:ABC-2 transporter permease n=1 Tax=Enorma phocaeensis TaxID=1871019 RepID=UPI0019590E3D|nr:ABC-2 transporter permease [Enorma phocaeensis]MBM6952862.1 ABC-2 transporter permease [Enorma phocaeensis]